MHDDFKILMLRSRVEELLNCSDYHKWMLQILDERNALLWNSFAGLNENI